MRRTDRAYLHARLGNVVRGERPRFWGRLLKWCSIALALIVLLPYFSLVVLLQIGEWMAGEDRPLHESIYFRTDTPHTLTLIDDGPTSFAKRIELIEGAVNPFEMKHYLKGSQTPVFFGSAINNFGVKELLDAFVEMAPAPAFAVNDRTC